MKVKIINTRTGKDLANRARFGKSLWTRAFGLIGRKDFKKGDGLIFNRSNGIHTLFMRFNLDIIYLNKDKIVINVFEKFPKWSFSPLLLKSADIIELPEGTIRDSGTMVGDQLQFEKSENY